MLAPSTTQNKAAPPETIRLFFNACKKVIFCPARFHISTKTPKVGFRGKNLNEVGRSAMPPSKARYTSSQIGIKTNNATNIRARYVNIF